MAKPLKVWNGSEWIEVAAQLIDTDVFLLASTASAVYLTQASASATYALATSIQPADDAQNILAGQIFG